MNAPYAFVREDYLVVVKQWLPESCEWKEVIAAHCPSYDEARLKAIALTSLGRQGFVANAALTAEKKTGEESK